MWNYVYLCSFLILEALIEALKPLKAIAADISGMKDDISSMKDDISSMKDDISGMRKECRGLFKELGDKFDEMRIDIKNDLRESRQLLLNEIDRAHPVNLQGTMRSFIIYINLSLQAIPYQSFVMKYSFPLIYPLIPPSIIIIIMLPLVIVSVL